MIVAYSSLAARSGLPASTQPAKTHVPIVNSQVATCPLRVRERAQRCSAGVLHITLTLSKLLTSNTFLTDTDRAHRPKCLPGSLKHLAIANGARRPTLPLYVNFSRPKSRALSSDPMVEIQHRLEFGNIALGGFVPMLALQGAVFPFPGNIQRHGRLLRIEHGQNPGLAGKRNRVPWAGVLKMMPKSGDIPVGNYTGFERRNNQCPRLQAPNRNLFLSVQIFWYSNSFINCCDTSSYFNSDRNLQFNDGSWRDALDFRGDLESQFHQGNRILF